ncbi:MAG: hypothetical protein U0Q21_10805 [Dermatophilaceae bacterium]
MPKNPPKPTDDPTKQAPRPVVWMTEPEAHDYPAAAAYLSLLAPAADVTRMVDALEAAATVTRKAKDILRASGLPLLDVTNPHVAGDLRKIAAGQRLSPVLIVRGDLATGRSSVVADGYHRVCASYHTDENTDIPIRLADLPAT